MLDNALKINKEEAKVYPPLPKNIYQVELLDITLKDAKGKYAKPGDKNFVFQFTLLTGKNKDEDLRGRNVWNNFVPTALYIGKNGKNALYQIVEAFLGRELTPEEEARGLSGQFLNSFIGKQIKIFVDHRADKKDPTKIYDNITSYMPAETLFNALTDEEKETARVKTKEEKEQGGRIKEEYDPEQPLDSHIEEPTDFDVVVNQIPF